MDAQSGVIDNQRREPAYDLPEGHVAVIAANSRQPSLVVVDSACASYSHRQQLSQRVTVVIRVTRCVPGSLAVTGGRA